MRVNELVKATDNTKIYLDMDGVLADFFHEYAKLAGVKENPEGRSDYRKIPLHLREPIINQLVGTDFFGRLPKFPTSDSLVKLVLGYVSEYHICSSPLREDMQNSADWKRRWNKKNLNPQPKTQVYTLTKETHAVNLDGSPNILIDDRGTNIVAWRAHGGIGIKYQADEDSLEKVKQALDLAFKH